MLRCSALGALLCLCMATLATAQPVIIIHPDNDATADLEKVRRIYLAKDRGIGPQDIIQPLDVDERNPIRRVFLDSVVEKSEDELRQYWSRLVFTGKATPPRNVGGDAEVKQFVARNKDVIGCIDSALVDASVKVLVKVQ